MVRISPRLLSLERSAQAVLAQGTAGADRLGACDVEDVIGEEERGEGAVAVGAARDRQGGDGELVVRTESSWSFLAAASFARQLGEHELADRLCRMVIDFQLSQPEGAQIARHLQLAVVHALLGEPEAAIENLHRMREDSYRGVWIVRAFDMSEDALGIYGGLSNNIDFMDAVARLEEVNTSILERLRVESPGLFPPASLQLN